MSMPVNILLVDDEPNIIVPLKFLLEQNGYRVQVATTGEEAFTAIETFRPDLVLLDIMLPTIDGYEVCHSVREKPEFSNVRILFITAMGRDVDVAKGLALGADGYITKPFANAEILAKVRELVG